MKKQLLLLFFIFFLSVGCGSVNRVAESGKDAELSHFDAYEVISVRKWRVYARSNSINTRTGESRNPVTVLGHYPEYVELTEELGAESMQVPMDQWDAMTPEEQWQTTTGFFDRMMQADHNFRLATPVERARPGSYYVRELNYLFGKGYKLSPDGLWLIR